MTASLLGPVDRQNALPDSGSSHAFSKCTPSSPSILRSAEWASSSCSAVTPTKPLCTSMNFAMGTDLLLTRLLDGLHSAPYGRGGHRSLHLGSPYAPHLKSAYECGGPRTGQSRPGRAGRPDRARRPAPVRGRGLPRRAALR